jgi:hypothetical protein
LASETVVVPVEGDLCMYATLAEDAELRTTSPMEDGTRLRIVAYDDDNDYVSDAIYTVNSDEGGIEPEGTGLSVPAAGTYTFVAVSYNSTTILPPYFLSMPATVNIEPGNDLLWGKTEETVTEGTNNVEIKMCHLFSRVTVEVSTENISNDTYTIDDIWPSSRIEPSYGGKITLMSGVPFPEYVYPAYFSSWEDIGSQTVTSSPIFVYTDGEYPILIYLARMFITNGTTTFAGIFTPQFNMNLESGKSYTLTASFERNVTFAGSNIYWDGNNLTFDAAGETTNQMRQGVFFKWGSLVGISGAGQSWDAYDAAATKIYAPKYSLGSWGWEDPNSYHLDWEDIPSLTAPNIAGSRSNTYLLDGEQNDPVANWQQDKTGDICRFLSANGYGPIGYRMPTSLEFGERDSYSYDDVGGWTRVGGSTWDMYGATIIPEANAGGTYLLSYGAANGGFVLPASGYRRDTDGVLLAPNDYGFYWSASVAYPFTVADAAFNQYGAPSWSSGEPLLAFSVRCVKN